MIEETISEQEAQRFYDAFGTRLGRMDAFEGRAKSCLFEHLQARPGEAVLELGIGLGDGLLEALARVGAEGRVLGIDLSKTMLTLSAERCQSLKSRRALTLLRASARVLPVAAASQDWVFSLYLLDLLPLATIPTVLGELRRVLKPGGTLLLCGLTEGESLLGRSVMAVWKRLHKASPRRVGGCRPLRLGPLVQGAGLDLTERVLIEQKGLSSEVIIARRAERAGPRAGGRLC